MVSPELSPVLQLAPWTTKHPCSSSFLLPTKPTHTGTTMKLNALTLLFLLGASQAATLNSWTTLKKTPDNAHLETPAPRVASPALFTAANTTTTITSPATSGSSSSRTAPIEIVGRKFFNSQTKEQFFLKGIAYQPSRATNDAIAISYDGLTIIDPMADTRLCLRDLPYLSALGVNTVRVYAIDTDKSHDDCFKAYAEAGIYVLADLSEPDSSVNRKTPSWDTSLLLRYKSVVDSLHAYDNVLGFFAGNEVTNDKTNTDASPFVKAAIRDTKDYIKEQGYRKIPVGYASNDDADTREDLASYFACGEGSADFYGINMYEWCGYSSFYTSGYKDRTDEFKNSPIPVFFSEFGCNLERPRPFTEVDALFSRLMTDVWSGGLVYMYFEEPNEYGVVLVDSEGNIAPLADYHNLQKAYMRSHPEGVVYSEYKNRLESQSLKEVSCPGSSSTWKAASSLPGSPDQVKCSCMESSLECKLSTSVKKAEFSKIFAYACGEVDCGVIRTDGESGLYGAYSDCTPYQKASYVLNEVYKKEGSKIGGCNFEGVAQLSNSVASKEQLESTVTLSGDTCAEFMKKAHTVSKTVNVGDKASVGSNSTSRPNSGNFSSSDGDSSESSASSQKTFYNRILAEVGAAFLVVALVTVVS